MHDLDTGTSYTKTNGRTPSKRRALVASRKAIAGRNCSSVGDQPSHGFIGACDDDFFSGFSQGDETRELAFGLVDIDLLAHGSAPVVRR